MNFFDFAHATIASGNRRKGGNGMSESKKQPDPKRLCELARMADEDESTDVLGSYTGMAQGGEPPVQDADDL